MCCEIAVRLGFNTLAEKLRINRKNASNMLFYLPVVVFYTCKDGRLDQRMRMDDFSWLISPGEFKLFCFSCKK